MKKIKLIPLLLAAVLAMASTVGCTKSPDKNTSSSSMIVEPGKLEGIADKEISAAVEEPADANETTFKLNSVIDSGQTDDKGNKYIYLDVTITNGTNKQYDMSVLNNFYILLPGDDEIHFDVRTQLYGTKNIESYVQSPFTIPAAGEFSGLIGGFILNKDASDFTVCFFPTQDNERDKSNVVKVKMNISDLKSLNG